jgi:hypothetical protein
MYVYTLIQKRFRLFELLARSLPCRRLYSRFIRQNGHRSATTCRGGGTGCANHMC